MTQLLTPPVYLKLHFAPGECAQVDWGAYGTVAVGNTRRRLSLFVMVLAFTRAKQPRLSDLGLHLFWSPKRAYSTVGMAIALAHLRRDRE